MKIGADKTIIACVHNAYYLTFNPTSPTGLLLISLRTSHPLALHLFTILVSFAVYVGARPDKID